jgi:hypothetical protein
MKVVMLGLQRKRTEYTYDPSIRWTKSESNRVDIQKSRRDGCCLPTLRANSTLKARVGPENIHSMVVHSKSLYTWDNTALEQPNVEHQ